MGKATKALKTVGAIVIGVAASIAIAGLAANAWETNRDKGFTDSPAVVAPEAPATVDPAQLDWTAQQTCQDAVQSALGTTDVSFKIVSTTGQWVITGYAQTSGTNYRFSCNAVLTDGEITAVAVVG